MTLVDQHQRELQRQRMKAAAAQRAVADLSKRLVAKQQALGRTRTPTRQRSLQVELERLARDRVKAEQMLAARQRDVARLEAKVVREQHQVHVQAERRRAQLEHRLDATTAGLDVINARFDDMVVILLEQARDEVAADTVHRKHDVFLSHASPDRDSAQRLYAELETRGVDVWVDDAELRLGASLFRQIDRGIANSRLGIVLVTPALLKGRQWTEREVGGLLTGGRRVVPVLDGVGFEDLAGYSPLLADLVGLSTRTESWAGIAEAIASTLRDAANAASDPRSEPADAREGEGHGRDLPTRGGAPGITSGRRLLGQDAGVVRIAEDFDAPLPAGVLAGFEQ